MRYYIGAEARLRRNVEDIAMSVFQGWDYEEVITPSVDYYELFEQGMGQREAQRGFRFTDHDGRLLALRPDVTSSVARMAATLLAERPRPLRFCYAAPVFRQQTQSHAEWRRENTQLGCELIGTGGKPADLEVLRKRNLEIEQAPDGLGYAAGRLAVDLRGGAVRRDTLVHTWSAVKPVTAPNSPEATITPACCRSPVWMTSRLTPASRAVRSISVMLTGRISTAALAAPVVTASTASANPCW